MCVGVIKVGCEKWEGRKGPKNKMSGKGVMAYMWHGSKGSHLEVEGNQQQEDRRMGKKSEGGWIEKTVMMCKHENTTMKPTTLYARLKWK